MKAQTLNHCEEGPLVTVIVQGSPVKFLVDTGANVTILRSSVLRSLPTTAQPALDQVNLDMSLADGRSLPFLGRGLFRVSIGGVEVAHQVWVADIEPEGILGMDFIREHGCRLTVDQDSFDLAVNYTKQELGGEECSPRCARIAVGSTTVIPPRSEALVSARLVDPCVGGEWGVTQGKLRFMKKNQVVVAKSLVDVNAQGGRVLLRMLNPADKPRTVYKDAIAAWCEPVEEVVEPGGTCSGSTPAGEGDRPSVRTAVASTGSDAHVPDHLVDLLARSSESLNQDQQGELASLLHEFGDVFASSSSDLGRSNVVKHQIKTGETRPIRQRPRRLPVNQRPVAEQEVEKMLKQGVIEPSSSPWASPVVLVRKKDGSTRFCVDYRRLNDVTIKDSYPLPRIDDSLDALAGSEWFSTLDLASGYWQVEVDESDRPKTAFTTGSGLFQFTVMPFGLCNAPATFERLMEHVLSGLPWDVCLLYLDDIIVHANNFQDEMKRLKTVFERLANAGLKLSPKKCHLFRRRVTFLGHVVSGEGISTDPDKVVAIRDWPVPLSPSEVRSFLGLCSYYRRFVQGFASIAAPLYRLTEKAGAFEWSEECEDAFRHLKQVLMKAPILAYPNTTASFILDTDASNHGIGAVLSQVQGGEERAIAYFSRALTKTERRYCVTRKELLAVVQAVKHFHHYLYGKPFAVRTDHGALKWLLNFKSPEGQVARWIEVLGTYSMKIEHCPGIRHGNADGLSRRPCTDCRQCEKVEEKEPVHGEAAGEEVTPTDPVDGETEARRLRSVNACAKEPREPEAWVAGKCKEGLRQEQLRDKDIAQIISWKEATDERPTWPDVSPENCAVKSYWSQWERLQLRDNVLYRRWEAEAGDTVQWQLVVPKGLRAEILREMHDAKTAGHLGVTKTLGRIKQRFYWYRCSQDVKDWCRRCDSCAARKPPQKKPRSAMKTYNVGAPLERVALDVLGPLPESERGNKYILVVADYFTKWTEAYAIPNQEAATVATKVVEEFVARMGVPRQIHSDQGRNFEAAVFQEMCALLGIEKTRTTPLHPQSDGMVERYNRTLEAMLAKFVSENQRDWDEHLPLVMMAYRTAVHETTGCTPCSMMLGREAAVPVDLLFGRPEQECAPDSETEYARQLRERMAAVHRFAREHLRLESDRQKRYYDHRGVHQNTFKRGDAVWLYNPRRRKGLSPKLQYAYEGPYLVVKRLDDLTFRIQRGPKAKAKVVHHNRLKPYLGDGAPDWLAHEGDVEGQSQDAPTVEDGGLPSSPSQDETPKRKNPRRSRRAPAWTVDYHLD